MAAKEVASLEIGKRGLKIREVVGTELAGPLQSAPRWTIRSAAAAAAAAHNTPESLTKLSTTDVQRE